MQTEAYETSKRDILRLLSRPFRGLRGEVVRSKEGGKCAVGISLPSPSSLPRKILFLRSLRPYNVLRAVRLACRISLISRDARVNAVIQISVIPCRLADGTSRVNVRKARDALKLMSLQWDFADWVVNSFFRGFLCRAAFTGLYVKDCKCLYRA